MKFSSLTSGNTNYCQLSMRNRNYSQLSVGNRNCSQLSVRNRPLVSWNFRGALRGAGGRHSACGKGHEEGGLTYAKVGSSLKSPPGNPWASTPITRACLLYYFVPSPTPLTLQGAVPTTSFGEGVNLELQLIKTPGCDKSVLTYKILWRFSSLPDRLVQPHVIAHSLPTVRGTRCFKPSKNRFFREVRKL